MRVDANTLYKGKCLNRLHDFVYVVMSARMSKTPVAIGQRIRSRRMELRIKSNELAELAGIHPSSLSQIETGRRRPDTTTLERIAAPLDWSLSELLEGTTAGAIEGKHIAPRKHESEPSEISTAVQEAVNIALADFATRLVAALGEWSEAITARQNRTAPGHPSGTHSVSGNRRR